MDPPRRVDPILDDKRPRKRASHACLKCRQRKVRCDVTICGPPCLNCHLDSEKCQVNWSRRARRHERTRELETHRQRASVQIDSSVGGAYRTIQCRRDETEDEGASIVEPATAINESLNSTPFPAFSIGSGPSNEGRWSRPQGSKTRLSHVSEELGNLSALQEEVAAEHERASPETLGHRVNCGGGWDEDGLSKVGDMSPSTGTIPSSLGASDASSHLLDSVSSNPYYVSYSYFRFLSISNLSAVPPQDFQFLERQGCLHVPSRPVLDEFVRQYFLYLQPILPILDEGAFWDAYACRPGSIHVDDRISLVLFQAMLFACCNLVSRVTLRQLGFSTKRSARASFYRRAKLLFDLETEVSSMKKSQAALLLASWSFSAYEVPRTPNTPWLSVAIQYAKDAEAHRYMAFDTESEEHTVRKRLWWCCIIRDRLLSLGMRRRFHITPADFDFDRYSPLGCYDLRDEIGRSMVHDAATQERLNEIFGLLVQLCVVISDIIDVSFPVEDSLDQRHRRPLDRLEKSRKGLHAWQVEATRRLHKASTPVEGDRVHDSVVLNINLLNMYYYAAKIALGHFEILQMAITAGGAAFPASFSDFVWFSKNRSDLQDAVIETTGCLENLMRSRLVDHLPITAISCTALPLVLHALDAERSGSSSLRDSKQTRVVRRRLEVLRAAMETYRFQYEGVEWISKAINHVIGLARGGSVFEDTGPLDNQNQNYQWAPAEKEDECHMPRLKSGCYLRLALTLDVAFSKGQLPADDGFRRRFPGLPRPDMAAAGEGWRRADVYGARDEWEETGDEGETFSQNNALAAESIIAQTESPSTDTAAAILNDDAFDWADVVTSTPSHDMEEVMGFSHSLSAVEKDCASDEEAILRGEGKAGDEAQDWSTLFCIEATTL